MCIIYGQIFSAICYSIGHSINPSTYFFRSNELNFIGQADFLTIYSETVSITSLNTTPCFVIFMVPFQPGVPEALTQINDKTETIGWICIAQSLLLLFGIFVNPV